jgi:pimeloyl-ACP methyl ester carboxylesterase
MEHSEPALPRGRMSLRQVGGRYGGKVYLYVPRSWRPHGPVLVAVHGISRNAREQVQMFSSWADRAGFAIVAPFFGRDHYRDYQRLGLERGGRRADEFLNSALDAFEQWTGAPVSDVSVFGFSGGAQFAHRYALLNPGRVRALVLGAAGWYTMPDDEQPFPLGLADLPVPAEIARDKWLALPMLVVVGSLDTGRDETLRQTPHIDASQGSNRLERAQRFVAEMRAAAARQGIESNVEFALLDGVGHGFAESMKRGGLAEQALPFLGLVAPTHCGE